MRAAGHSVEFTVVLGEGRIETADALSVPPAILPEGSVYNTAEPHVGQRPWGQRPNIETWQLRSNSHHCQAESKAKEPGCLQSSSQSSLPHTFPGFTEGPRKNGSSVGLKSRISTALRTGERIPEWQTYSAADSSDKGGALGMRQLWSGSHHYSEKNNSTNTSADFPIQPCPHLSWLIPAGELRAAEAQLYIWLQGQHWDFRGSEPYCP